MCFRVVIADGDMQAGLIASYLREHNIHVDTVPDDGSAVQAILTLRPDVVLLGLRLPEKKGFEICRKVRANYNGVVIMMASGGEEFDELLGFEMGADNYLRKPVKSRILLARIQAHLRRAGDRLSIAKTQGDSMDFGGFSINRANRTIYLPDGSTPELTTLEFDLLWSLACRAGEVVNRNDLLLKLRGIEFDGVNRAIDGLICRLRRKLQDSSGSFQRIKTIRNKGYQFSKADWG
ncbi:winged helix-turn-helix domain-containing protein [Burkholderia mayonis]|uniref:winged helix-turn-helix domain-containing protein n=1 Tax=Burkholderia mayonis TaxID=1385591 RepID=UPI0009E72080|nr:winged helix-turn-helix domain-containing protein [Burkholderia mayonis]